MDGKFLGKITKASYGLNSDGHFGLDFELSFDGRSTHMFRGLHAIERFDGSDSTLDFDPDRQFGEASLHTEWLLRLLHASKRRSVDKLVGTPVQVTVDGNLVANWRVLTEVL